MQDENNKVPIKDRIKKKKEIAEVTENEPIDEGKKEKKVIEATEKIIEEATNGNEEEILESASMKILEKKAKEVDERKDIRETLEVKPETELEDESFNALESKISEFSLASSREVEGTEETIEEVDVEVREKGEKITIDLNNLNVYEPDEKKVLAQIKIEQSNYENKIMKQVISPFSGYSFFMEGLTLSEIDSYKNSDVSDGYEERKLFYKLLYNKIVKTSLDTNGVKISFEEFLKKTCRVDVNLLAYGLLCTTFTDRMKFNLTCQNKIKILAKDKKKNKKICGKEIVIKIRAEQLIQIKNLDIYENIKKIIHSENNREALSHAILYKVKRIAINNNLVIDFQLPNMQKNLDILKLTPKDEANKLNRILALLLHVKVILKRDEKYFNETKKTRFLKYENMNEIFELISSKFNTSIIKKIVDHVEEEYKDTNYTFETPKTICPVCREQVTSSVDPEYLLFREIYEL